MNVEFIMETVQKVIKIPVLSANTSLSLSTIVSKVVSENSNDIVLPSTAVFLLKVQLVIVLALEPNAYIAEAVF